MEKLTDKQQTILTILKKLIAKNGYPPTVREIGKIAKLSSSATTHFHLKQLEKKGYIKQNQKKNRTLELLVPNEYLQTKEDTIEVPLLGKVTAGIPIEAIEAYEEMISLPINMFNSNKELFALNIEGESMINIGIYDKDIVIVEKTKVAKNKDIVVAMNEDNEATVKTFYKEKDHIRLQPENDNMAPIILDNVTILGKVIGLYRKF